MEIGSKWRDVLKICIREYMQGNYELRESEEQWKCYYCLESLVGEHIRIVLDSGEARQEVRFHKKCLDYLSD